VETAKPGHSAGLRLRSLRTTGRRTASEPRVGSRSDCWVKVGRGARSLPATGDNFLKPWFFIYVDHGRVSRFYFALKFVD
jgi:hypothetical protein